MAAMQLVTYCESICRTHPQSVKECHKQQMCEFVATFYLLCVHHHLFLQFIIIGSVLSDWYDAQHFMKTLWHLTAFSLLNFLCPTRQNTSDS